MKDNLIEFEGELYERKNKFPWQFIFTIIWAGVVFYFWEEIHQTTKFFCIFSLGCNVAVLINKLTK